VKLVPLVSTFCDLLGFCCLFANTKLNAPLSQLAGPKTAVFMARQVAAQTKFSRTAKWGPSLAQKVLTFERKYGTLLSVNGVMKSRKSGMSKSLR
jgi:hypothetical protein